MVLAKRVDLNIPYDDQLVMVLVEHRTIDDITQVLLISLCEEEQGLGITLRCLQQSLAIGIFANAFEDGSYGAGQLL